MKTTNQFNNSTFKTTTMKTTINNLDTPFSICTYSMFTGESTYEMEIEEYHNDGVEIDFETDHKQVVKDLAKNSISILEDLTKQDGIIQSITLLNTYSPKFYNYTTDSYDMEIEFDEAKLIEFLNTNDIDNGNEDPIISYLSHQIDLDDYNMWMWEQETEIYLNNITTIVN